MFRNVGCAISGGVDSAAAAMLLKKNGFNITGLFMRNWDQANEHGHCISDHDWEDAQYVCDKLDIPLVKVNYVKEYWNEVFSNFLKGYEGGITPNPDVLCNKFIKFGHFFHHAVDVLGLDALATGHYARSSYGNFLEHYDVEKGAKLLSPHDLWKDQTLFLCQMKQQSLQKTMFPLGNLLKKDVKQLVCEAGLEKIAIKKESVGICFIGSRNFAEFIEQYIEPKQGKFIHIETEKVVGTHKGTHHFTIGQRSRISGFSTAHFIVKMDTKTQDIHVAPGTDHPALYRNSFMTSIPHWIHSEPPELVDTCILECDFRFQHIHPLMKCKIVKMDNNDLFVELEHNLRALTKGQYAVFYKDGVCLGSAEIKLLGPSAYEINTNVHHMPNKIFL